MTRVKKGVNALKTRRNVLAKVKGYRFGRSTKQKQATEAIFHAGAYAFAHRKDKKGDARRNWNVKISYALKEMKGETKLSYSKLIGALKNKNIMLDRKILAGLSSENPETFKKVVEFTFATAPTAKISAKMATGTI